jgi:hypothetical protein
MSEVYILKNNPSNSCIFSKDIFAMHDMMIAEA